MTDRTLAEAMGMSPQETAELREKAEALAGDYNDDVDCRYGQSNCRECGLECTWCGGDGIGDGCHDEIQCCGEDFCHPCRGTGLRSNQTVF